MQAVVNYFKSAFGELHYVTWPSRQEVIRYTLLILAAVILATLIIAAIDYGLDLAVNHWLI